MELTRFGEYSSVWSAPGGRRLGAEQSRLRRGGDAPYPPAPGLGERLVGRDLAERFGLGPQWAAQVGYAAYRNTIEGWNGYVKGPESIFVALLLMAANFRKIAAFRQLVADARLKRWPSVPGAAGSAWPTTGRRPNSPQSSLLSAARCAKTRTAIVPGPVRQS